MEDRWLSVEEIATYLGVKRDTVYKWVRLKGMPHHKVGRLVKLQKDEIEKWVKSGWRGNRERETLRCATSPRAY